MVRASCVTEFLHFRPTFRRGPRARFWRKRLMSKSAKSLVGRAAGLVRCVATELAAIFIHLSAAANRVEGSANSSTRSVGQVQPPGVSPSLAELREGAANVVAAVLVKARGRELTDHKELEKALRASSAVV